MSPSADTRGRIAAIGGICEGAGRRHANVDAGERLFWVKLNQLAAEHQKSTTTLNAVSAQQRQPQTGDAVGVFLIGVPMSSLTGGDKEGAGAQQKGELIAIGSAQRNKGC